MNNSNTGPATVPDAVIFDLDGVIVDSEPLQLASFNQILASYDVKLTTTDFKALVGQTQPEIFAALKARFGIEERVESLIARKLMAYRKLVEIEIVPMPGLRELIAGLKAQEVKMGVASSSPLDDIEHVLRCIGLRPAFDVVCSALDLPRGKPHPDVFLKTAAALGVEPTRCLVLEDSATGVEAAKRAGMTCIAMPNFFTAHQDFSRADFVVRDLSAARDAIGHFRAPRSSIEPDRPGS